MMETISIDRRIQEIFDTQKTFSKKLRSEPFRNRMERLDKLENWILANRDRIRLAVYQDFNKTNYEADLSEIYASLAELRETKKNLKYWTRPKKVSGGMNFLGSSAYVQYEPRGVCLIIAPWNYPFTLMVGPLVSALAAGNTAILKPSEFTPHTSQLIAEMAGELFGEDLVAVVQGDHEVSAELCRMSFDHIFFTGSPQVGKIVMQAATQHLTSVTLELGGKSPTIIDRTADLADAAQKIAWGKWMNAGQTCVAPDYLLVHKSVREEFTRQLKKQVEKLEDHFPDPTVIVNDRHFQRLAGMMEDAIDKGAEIRFGGNVDSARRSFGITLLSGATLDMKIMKEEIFGPILPMITFSEIEEALDLIERFEKPLALYIFSRDKNAITRFEKETTSGGMCVNECLLQFSHPGLPFGGVNNSGIGNSHGIYGFRAFSHEKAVLKQRTGLTMGKTLYPPLDRIKKLTLDILIKYL